MDSYCDTTLKSQIVIFTSAKNYDSQCMFLWNLKVVSETVKSLFVKFYKNFYNRPNKLSNHKIAPTYRAFSSVIDKRLFAKYIPVEFGMCAKDSKISICDISPKISTMDPKNYRPLGIKIAQIA